MWPPEVNALWLNCSPNRWSKQLGCSFPLEEPMQFPFNGCVPLARLAVEVGRLPGIRDTFQRSRTLVSPVGAWRPSLPRRLPPLGCLWSVCLLKPPPQVTSCPPGPTAVSLCAPLPLVSVTDHPLHLSRINVSSSLYLFLSQCLRFCLLPSIYVHYNSCFFFIYVRRYFIVCQGNSVVSYTICVASLTLTTVLPVFFCYSGAKSWQRDRRHRQLWRQDKMLCRKS